MKTRNVSMILTFLRIAGAGISAVAWQWQQFRHRFRLRISVVRNGSIHDGVGQTPQGSAF